MPQNEGYDTEECLISYLIDQTFWEVIWTLSVRMLSIISGYLSLFLCWRRNGVTQTVAILLPCLCVFLRVERALIYTI